MKVTEKFEELKTLILERAALCDADPDEQSKASQSLNNRLNMVAIANAVGDPDLDTFIEQAADAMKRLFEVNLKGSLQRKGKPSRRLIKGDLIGTLSSNPRPRHWRFVVGLALVSYMDCTGEIPTSRTKFLEFLSSFNDGDDLMIEDFKKLTRRIVAEHLPYYWLDEICADRRK